MAFENIINFFEKGKGPWEVIPENNDKGGRKEGKKINSEQKIENFLKQFFKQKGNKRGDSNKPKKNPFNFIKKSKKPKTLIGFSIIVLLIIWLSSGIYIVNPDENGVVSYFGKLYSITNSGLNFYIPKPIGDLQKVSTARINKEEFGVLKQEDFKIRKNNLSKENLMLTSDENILDINFEVQWKVANIKDYLFNIANPKTTIRTVAESAMQEIIAQKTINDIVLNKRSEIEQETKQLLQETLDSYNSGIEIVLIQTLRAEPPKEVIDPFYDIQTTKTDKERKIQEAEGYKTDLMLKAKAEAEQIIQEAEGYKKAMIANAEGQASRFNNVYREYRRAKNVTKKRMYLETMEEIFSNTNKIIVDDNIQQNIIPYSSLNNNNNK